jgi:hypothetical protein
LSPFCAKSTASLVKAQAILFGDYFVTSDSQAVMQSIGDARADMLEAIGSLSKEFSEFKGTVTESIKNTNIRIGNIEDKQKTQENRQWYHSMIVFGANLLHHDLGQWLHWRI